MITDTIAAISTGTGSTSGIGIIRLSGDKSIEIVDKMFISKSKKRLEELESYKASYGIISDNGNIIDEAIVLVMRAPHSYTTEDVVEIQSHGGTYVLRKILEVVLKNGAKLAEPGEFTKRAFLNGRLDLSQAEAVMDIISSTNSYAHKMSINQLEGGLSKKIRQLRATILENTALIEAALDDPEHFDLSEYEGKISQDVDNLVDSLNQLLITSDNGKIYKDGINTVILGKPNAGKSSLLNLLSGQDRAIVTDIEGTTRDALCEQIILDGIILKLIDTAGIRETKDFVEQLGVKKSFEYADVADLIIYVVDSSKKLDENDEKILDYIKDKKAIILLNKQDLESIIGIEEFKGFDKKYIVPISVKSQEGLQELSSLIKEMFINGEVNANEEAFLTNVRQKEAIKDAYESILLVKESINNNMPEDCYTIDFLNAYEKLGLIIGESVSDDLANEIFSKFCMGK